jgi:hypothetical protein
LDSLAISKIRGSGRIQSIGKYHPFLIPWLGCLRNYFLALIGLYPAVLLVTMT